MAKKQNPELGKAVIKYLTEHPEATDAGISRKVGVSRTTITKTRNELERNGDLQRFSTMHPDLFKDTTIFCVLEFGILTDREKIGKLVEELTESEEVYVIMQAATASTWNIMFIAEAFGEEGNMAAYLQRKLNPLLKKHGLEPALHHITHMEPVIFTKLFRRIAPMGDNRNV